MYESRFSLFYKIPMVLVVLVLAVELLLLSLRLATANGKAANADWAANLPGNPRLIYNDIGSNSQRFATASEKITVGLVHGLGHKFSAVATGMGRGISSGFHAIARVPVGTIHFATHATDVKAFLQPSATVQVPIISPVPDPPTLHIAEARPVAQPATVIQQTVRHVANVKPVTTATSRQISYANDYAWGNCTWWAALRRAQVGDPIPGNWGNAATWASRAASDGYVVNHQPGPGAIMQTPYSAGGLGHVAFVESVDPHGTWHISEMNVIGLDRVDHKAMPASAAASYSFIHDRN